MKLSHTLLVVVLLLASCGGRTQAPVIENPYAVQMQELTSNGVLAMQRERWVAAEHSFVRALQAAELTADPALIAHAWYNLGMAYAERGDKPNALEWLEKFVASAHSKEDAARITTAEVKILELKAENEL